LAIDYPSLLASALDFFKTYVLAGLITLIIALLVVSFSIWSSHRRSEYLLRAALRAEIENNMQIAKALGEYARVQITSETTVQPMPRFHDAAYKEYKRAGLLTKLPPKNMEELENLYLYEESVNEAGRRQEDLAFGPSSAYPNAHSLRLQNLQYVIDTAHNVIKPYRERVREMRL